MATFVNQQVRYICSTTGGQKTVTIAMYDRGNNRWTGTVSSPSSIFGSSILKSSSSFTFTAYFQLNGGSGSSNSKSATGSTKVYYVSPSSWSTTGAPWSISGTTLTWARSSGSSGQPGSGWRADLTTTYSTSRSTSSAYITLHGAPSKTGYTFAGWKSDSGSVFSAGAKVSRSSGGSRTYTAQWTANNYYIAFNKNAADATGSMGNQTCTYNNEVTLNENKYQRAGYAFDSWNTKADGSGTKYTDKAKIKNLATSGTITLYAQWLELKCTLVYNIDDYPVRFEKADNGDIIGKFDDQPVIGDRPAIETFYYIPGRTITFNDGKNLSCYGYNLIGWVWYNHRDLEDTYTYMDTFDLGETIQVVDDKRPFSAYKNQQMNVWPLWERVSRIYVDGQWREILDVQVYKAGWKPLKNKLININNEWRKIITKDDN